MRILKFLMYLDFALLIILLVLFFYLLVIEKRVDWGTIISVAGCLVRLAFERYALKNLKSNES